MRTRVCCNKSVVKTLQITCLQVFPSPIGLFVMGSCLLGETVALALANPVPRKGFCWTPNNRLVLFAGLMPSKA